MKQIVRLNTIYNGDLYTRAKAIELKDCINRDAATVILDFKGIMFMSRSFADELCDVIEEFQGITFEFINRVEEIEVMMTKVSEGRKRERIRGISPAKMYEFKDMESLSEFLLAQ